MSQLPSPVMLDPLPPSMERAMAHGKTTGQTVTWPGAHGGGVCYSLWLPRLGNPGKARLWPKLASLKDRSPQEVYRLWQ